MSFRTVKNEVFFKQNIGIGIAIDLYEQKELEKLHPNTRESEIK